jgi:hypothetical protein
MRLRQSVDWHLKQRCKEMRPMQTVEKCLRDLKHKTKSLGCVVDLFQSSLAHLVGLGLLE